MGPISSGLGEVFQFTVRNRALTLMQLEELLDWQIRPALRTVPGVVEVNSFGGQDRQYQVILDPKRLQAAGISIAQVVEALENSNANAGGAVLSPVWKLTHRAVRSGDPRARRQQLAASRPDETRCAAPRDHEEGAHMRGVLGWVAFVSLLSGACDDDSEDLTVDASYRDGAMHDAGALLECQRADEELGRRYAGQDAALRSELARCAKDEDCTTWTPIFRCEDRDVQLTQCSHPLAVGKLEAAQLWFHQLEQELCPNIKPNCRGTPSCVGGALRCVDERCTLVRDGGLLVRDGGA